MECIEELRGSAGVEGSLRVESVSRVNEDWCFGEERFMEYHGELEMTMNVIYEG